MVRGEARAVDVRSGREAGEQQSSGLERESEAIRCMKRGPGSSTGGRAAPLGAVGSDVGSRRVAADGSRRTRARDAQGAVLSPLGFERPTRVVVALEAYGVPDVDARAVVGHRGAVAAI